MMIKEVTMYTAICDNCGANICDGTEYAGWCKDGIQAELDSENWLEIDGKQYCNDCCEYDDNDELILKELPNA